jgi:heavy metal sensor kinase
LHLDSIRVRLTLWYAAALAVVLLVFGLGTYLFVRANLHAQVDNQLDADLAVLQRALEESPEQIYEVQAHAILSFFSLYEGDWQIFVGGGWSRDNLEDAMRGAPMGERWIWRSGQGRRFHLKQRELVVDGRNYRLAAGRDSEQIHRSLWIFLLALLFGAPLAIAVSLAGGYFLAGRALWPLQRLTARARAVNAENLSERLAVQNPHDELGQLTVVLNDAFARLEDAFARLKRFTQDAAHELRTPLAVLRSVGEVGLQEQRDTKAYREIIGSMLEEVDRLGHLVDGLLTLARAESGRFSVQRRPEDLRALCQDVVECLRVLAEDKSQTLTFDATGAAHVMVERDTLQIALINLIANGIRFTPQGGAIHVRLHGKDACATIEVRDNGPGIAKEHHAHLFERFYRVDPSRSQATGGSGLGLAIARWAVETSGGHIELESETGRGSCFRLVLPSSRESQPPLAQRT